jgi:branched-chain amino acid transport system ATP-binding protein
MLELQGLAVRYGAVEAVRGVDLHVGRGEAVALLGANGAGKTSLLRAASGLEPATAGRVLLDGEDITALRADERARRGLAHVPERRRIFPGLSVEENLRVGATAWARWRSPLASDLERVYGLMPRLAERRRQAGWSLSGGEQQMLALGRALMARPRVLLLDEPSLGLAPRLAEDVYVQLRRIASEGSTVLLVEQNTVLGLSVAVRGYVLEAGCITLEGVREALLGNPAVHDAYLGGGPSPSPSPG